MKKVFLTVCVALATSLSVLAGGGPNVISTPDGDCNISQPIGIRLSCQLYDGAGMQSGIQSALRESGYKMVMEAKAKYIIEFCYMPQAKIGGYDIKGFNATVSNAETGETVLSFSIKGTEKDKDVKKLFVEAMNDVFKK
ncbi:MAG: hypothetical protein MJ198_08790 [Bacteroidales bacterium]|nr:hypothetical protein [Bacteroidales bacterium]